MVIAHHLIWTGYGQWLPNDPRGSTSVEVRNRVLQEIGELHQGRKKIQPCGRELREFYREAAPLLEHLIINFTADQIQTVGDAFQEVVDARNYTVWACAIMPDHIHALVRRHRDHAEDMLAEFQRVSRLALIRRPEVPGDHRVWGGPGWKVFQETPDDVRRTVRYIEDNPVKYRLEKQDWKFVTPYNNWPLHKKMRESG